MQIESNDRVLISEFRRLLSRRRPQDANQLLKKFQDKLDIGGWNEVFHVAFQFENRTFAVELFKTSFAASKLMPNEKTANKIFAGVARSGSVQLWEECAKIFTETYNLPLGSQLDIHYLRLLLEAGEHVKLQSEYNSRVRSHDPASALRLTNLYLQSLSHQRDIPRLQLAFAALDKPNRESFIAMMSAYTNTHDYDAVQKYFEDYRARGLHVDATVFQFALRAASLSGNWPLVTILWQQMRAAEIKATVVILNSLCRTIQADNTLPNYLRTKARQTLAELNKTVWSPFRALPDDWQTQAEVLVSSLQQSNEAPSSLAWATLASQRRNLLDRS
jgi:hypothetical protein